MARFARTTRNRPPSPGPSTSAAAIVIAVLIGVSLPLLYAGFVESCYKIMDFTPLTFRLAVAAVLLSTALGPRLPGRAVLLIARAVRRPLTGPVEGRWIEEIAGSEPVPPSVDQALPWTASGVAGLAAGVGVLLLPAMIGTVGHLWKWGLSRFLWMNWPLTVFEGLILLLAALVPFVLLGFFMRCVHQLACPAGRWDFGAFGWVLVGAAVGFVGVACFCGHPLKGLLLMRAGAVPLLLAAMLSVSRASPSAARQPLADERLAVDEPDLGERWSAGLHIAVAVCVSGALTAGLVWTYVVGVMHTGAYAATLLAGGAMTFSAAVGLWAGSRRAAFAGHEIGRVGQHCAIAGVSVALGVAVLNVVTRASYAPFLSTPGYWLLWGLCACLPLGLAGYAIGQGGMAVLRRSPSRVRTGSGLLRMVFLAAAFTSLGVALPLLEALGSYATLVAAALALLATGGILIIHEPSFATGRARVRVATVFTAVLLMTWLMPAAGAGWLSTREHSRGRLVESWWLTYDVGPMGGARLLESTAPAGAEVRAAATTFPAHALDWSRLAPPCRVGVVSLLGDDRSWVPPTF